MGERKQALQDLLAKVEAGGEFYIYNLDAFDAENWDNLARAYHGSLDAAKALHDAMLPGWRWGTSQDAEIEYLGQYQLWVQDPNKAHQASFYRPSGRHEDPARAWLIAILQALIAAEAQ